MRKELWLSILLLILSVGRVYAQTPAGGYTSPAAGGSSVSPNSPLPAATSGPGPVFNVKNYGAFGDTQSSNNCTQTAFTLVCSDVTFTAADIGKRVSGALNFSVIQPATATITGFTNSTTVTLSQSNSGSGTYVWGHADDTAVTAAQTAAIAQMCSIVSSGNLCISSFAPTLYFPAGSYNLLNTSLNVAPSSARSGFAIRGDGADQSKIYWNTGTTNAQGAVVTCTGNVNNFVVENITFDGANGADTLSNAAVYTSCNTLVRNVIVQRFSVSGWTAPATLFANKLVIAGNGSSGLTMSGGGESYEGLFTNNLGAGFVVLNNTGANQGEGTRIYNNLFDENGGGGGCDAQIINSTDVWFSGPSIFSSTNGGTTCGVRVDGNSYLHWNGGIVGVFGSEPNRGGVTIAAGGTLEASDVHFIATGTAKCITNNGRFNDNGNNSCESQFPIVSGTSTGSAAVLTVTTASSNVSTNCTVGDALYVKGAATAGYNGYFPVGAITAVGTNTISYTTQGSNLGALGAGGVANCRNLQTYSGNLPVALLNNPIPNTCFDVTFGATVTGAPMCNFIKQSATNITRITASSTTSTTCAAAPVVTISDGAQSVTLTITSGKSQWDSAVDTSTGVGTTIFKPAIGPADANKFIQVTNTAGTCAVPPTNFAVSYNIAPILSN